MKGFNADYIIDACVSFFDSATYDLLISKLDQITNDGVIVESLQKSVSTTANVNARFKRVCEIIIVGTKRNNSHKLYRERQKILEKTFTDEQKEIFEKFQDCWSEYASLSEAEIFRYAFKLGMRIAIETLTK